MQEKVYFYLLIICGIWSQGIIGTFAAEIKKSSDFHNRQKRVISCVQGEDIPTKIIDAPYIVNIRYNKRIICVGSILSKYVVITIPQCVLFIASRYEVVSGISRSDHGTPRNIIEIRKHYGSHASRPTDGIALLTVDSPFVFGTFTYFIELHTGPLFPDTVGVISGWGYNNGSAINHGTSIFRKLRSISVNIMHHRDCVNIYRPYNIEITDEDVCTFDRRRHCGHTDGGAPLVVDGYLAGLHLWTGPNKLQNDPAYPEVFVILQHFYYSNWIRTNIHEIEAQFRNHHK